MAHHLVGEALRRRVPRTVQGRAPACARQVAEQHERVEHGRRYELVRLGWPRVVDGADARVPEEEKDESAGQRDTRTTRIDDPAPQRGARVHADCLIELSFSID